MVLSGIEQVIGVKGPATLDEHQASLSSSSPNPRSKENRGLAFIHVESKENQQRKKIPLLNPEKSLPPTPKTPEAKTHEGRTADDTYKSLDINDIADAARSKSVDHSYEDSEGGRFRITSSWIPPPEWLSLPERPSSTPVVSIHSESNSERTRWSSSDKSTGPPTPILSKNDMLPQMKMGKFIANVPSTVEEMSSVLPPLDSDDERYEPPKMLGKQPPMRPPRPPLSTKIHEGIERRTRGTRNEDATQSPTRFIPESSVGYSPSPDTVIYQAQVIQTHVSSPIGGGRGHPTEKDQWSATQYVLDSFVPESPKSPLPSARHWKYHQASDQLHFSKSSIISHSSPVQLSSPVQSLRQRILPGGNGAIALPSPVRTAINSIGGNSILSTGNLASVSSSASLHQSILSSNTLDLKSTESTYDPDPFGLIAAGLRSPPGYITSRGSSVYSIELPTEGERYDDTGKRDDWQIQPEQSSQGLLPGEADDSILSEAGFQELLDSYQNLSYNSSDVSSVSSLAGRRGKTRGKIDGRDIKLVPQPLFWDRKKIQARGAAGKEPTIRNVQVNPAKKAHIVINSSHNRQSSRASRGFFDEAVPAPLNIIKKVKPSLPSFDMKSLQPYTPSESSSCTSPDYREARGAELRLGRKQGEQGELRERIGFNVLSPRNSDSKAEIRRRKFNLNLSLGPSRRIKSNETDYDGPKPYFPPSGVETALDDGEDGSSSTAQELIFNKVAAKAKLKGMFQGLGVDKSEKQKHEQRVQQLKRSIQHVGAVDPNKVDYDVKSPGGLF